MNKLPIYAATDWPLERFTKQKVEYWLLPLILFLRTISSFKSITSPFTINYRSPCSGVIVTFLRYEILLKCVFYYFNCSYFFVRWALAKRNIIANPKNGKKFINPYRYTFCSQDLFLFSFYLRYYLSKDSYSLLSNLGYFFFLENINWELNVNLFYKCLNYEIEDWFK